VSECVSLGNVTILNIHECNCWGWDSRTFCHTFIDDGDNDNNNDSNKNESLMGKREFITKKFCSTQYPKGYVYHQRPESILNVTDRPKYKLFYWAPDDNEIRMESKNIV
jgi:hypothetical protein